MRAIVSVPLMYGIVVVVAVDVVGLLSFCLMYVLRLKTSVLQLFLLKTLFLKVLSLVR